MRIIFLSSFPCRIDSDVIVFGIIQKTKDFRCYVSHNHPEGGNTDPSSDMAWVGRRTSGNSGLCRLYITDSVGVQKIVKISLVGNIGSDAKT